MTSSMLSGERRWAASSRRGGMTVLGKVAVPKPINLPSQRLENHGLDPNVEIVPKGTLSWGSRSSSSTSNAWGSSLSPNTDGGTSSPSHLSARPSSGGSGTRPSTAGSDRALDSTTNAWGSNSRPSSASGALPTNQSSLTSLRPRSAETRPGSSQLSRFAEPLADNSGAWDAARTTENLGVTQPKNDGFSLSSGDFPSLGSDKDKSVSELQDHISHARPGSSPGPRKEINETSVGDDVPVNANNKAETVDYWRRDHQPYNEDGVRPSVEKWQGNSQRYPNTGFPPQHYDARHGPPVNNPQGCVWFRGPPSGPPFGNAVAPSGFPIEQFPYYRPHIPSTGLANPPPVPPPGIGPRGHHKNGDVYRPHMSDAYIRPGIPIRPGFYAGSMAYEGYYGPPMGYCNPNERDAPFMGMASGPVYNRYPNQNHPEPRNSEGRSGGHGNAGKQLTSEQVEPRHIPDTSGPFRVLLKQHESDGKNETTNWEDSESTDASYVHGRDQPRMAVWENEQRSNYRKHEMDLKTSVPGEKVSCQPPENQVSSSSVIGKPKSPDSSRNIKKSDDISSRKLDVTTASEMLEFFPKQSAQKDASLIQKIEGLNAKARDTSSARIREGRGSKFHAGNAPVNRVETEVDDVVLPASTVTTEGINPVHPEVGASAAEKNSEYPFFSRTDTSRRTAQGMQGRGDHRNKGRLNNQDADGWQKKSVIEESSASTGAQLEKSNVLVGEHCISVNLVRHDGEAVQTKSDHVDSYAQRAKLKELAKQRTKQLQEEEEERTRKQKAKALAKLDELNRRSQSLEGSTEKEYATGSSIQNKPQELQPSESAAAAGKSGVVSSILYGNANAVCQINDTGTSNVEKPPILSSEPALDMHKNSGKEPLLNHIQSRAVQQDVNNADATALHVCNNITTKQKRMGYKKKQNPPFDKTLNVPTTSLAPKKVQDDIAVDISLSSDIVTSEVVSAHGSGLPMSLSAAVESSMHPKKKNHRNGKNKNKVEESLSPATLPLAVPKEANLLKNPVESDKYKASDSELDQGSLQPALLSKDPNQFSEQHKHVANEESRVRTNSQWKSQHNRRTPRNMQGNRQAEKSHGSDAVMWAPVKSQNKIEVMDESNEKSKIEAVNPVKSDQQEHNLKNKRAELERYVPKPVAKEMAQQGTTQQQATSFISQAHTDDGVGRDDYGLQSPQIVHQTNAAVGRVGSGMESKNRNGRHKQGKAHGSWQQRNVTDSSHVHDMKNVLEHDSNSGPNVQRPTEDHDDQKSEIPFRRGQTKRFGDCSDLDGSNNPGNHDSVELVSGPVTKDHSTIGRGRRASSRGHRVGVVGVNHDVHHQKNAEETEQIEKHISFSEHGQPDVGVAFKENRVVVERLMSQWQPKSQASNNPRGTRPNDQNVSSAVVGTNKKDFTHDDESLLGGHGKSSIAQVAQCHHDQSVAEKSKAGEALHFGNQEAKREKRNAPTKRHPRSPNQASVSSVEQAPTGADLLHEQHPLSGLGKNGNQNWHGRGHESRRDWKSSTQDSRRSTPGSRRHNQSTNQERQGSNLQYEYQPVGPYDDSKLENFERPKDGNRGGGKFRERGQTHSRRGGGNSYGRQGVVD